ncbi:MAG: hypothetical protein K6A43_07615 [Treponema sp.]|nr:hypothetical protein [Treponema sp.]
MKKKIFILFMLIISAPLFAKVEIELGTGYNFGLGSTFDYTNSKIYTGHSAGISLGCSVSVFKNFGTFFDNGAGFLFNYRTDAGEVLPTGEVNYFYTLGLNYELPLEKANWLRFDLGFTSTYYPLYSGHNGTSDEETSAGGHGFAVNTSYSHKFTDWFALRFTVKNFFTWKTKYFKYEYPNDYSGMYYTKPKAYTKTPFFSWMVNPCIEAVFIIQKKPPKDVDGGEE